MMKKSIIVSLSAMILSGCFGYEPLYSQGGHVVADVRVGDIVMDEIDRGFGERRSAQLVAQRLNRIFVAGEGAPYTLNMSLREEKTTLALERDATEQRLQFDLIADMKLKDAENNVVFQTSMETSAPYNVEDTPFGTDSGRERARSSAVKVIADEAVHRVSFYFYNLHKKEDMQ